MRVLPPPSNALRSALKSPEQREVLALLTAYSTRSSFIQSIKPISALTLVPGLVSLIQLNLFQFYL